MAKVLEFDTFMQEAKGENLTVRVGGKDYSVPPKIPAIVPLMMARAEKLADQSSRNAAYSKMIFTDALFGEKAMTEICESGMTVDMLSLLVQKTFALINGVEDFDEEDSNQDSEQIEDGEKPLGRIRCGADIL